ncbi:MAG: hypothetical protein M3294_01835 [Pseudomonadota bacterium]|nr:hypothetical protein [Pseudomonadota bacterium]
MQVKRDRIAPLANVSLIGVWLMLVMVSSSLAFEHIVLYQVLSAGHWRAALSGQATCPKSEAPSITPFGVFIVQLLAFMVNLGQFWASPC